MWGASEMKLHQPNVTISIHCWCRLQWNVMTAFHFSSNAVLKFTTLSLHHSPIVLCWTSLVIFSFVVADECLTASLIIAETSLTGAGIINKIMKLSSEVSFAMKYFPVQCQANHRSMQIVYIHAFACALCHECRKKTFIVYCVILIWIE